MSLKSISLAALAAAFVAAPAIAEPHIMIHDPYARSAGKAAKAGAAVRTIMNHGDEADRLMSVASDDAVRVELHTHQENADGVMRMMHVKEGFEIPAEGARMLDRGGDHVMFMGLTAPWEQDDVLTVTFSFEKSGDMVVDIPVDLTRTSSHGQMDHGDNNDDGDHTNHDH